MENWKLTKEFGYKKRTIRYDIKGNGPEIVIVHGTPWSSFNLRHLIAALSDQYKVYYYDLIGYGMSDKKPGDVSLGIQNEILNLLIDHWKLENPYAIGHDFGGATVLRTYLVNKRAFKKMILIDPVAVSPWGSPFFKHVKKYENAFAEVPEYIHDAIVRAYIKTAAYKPIDDNTMDQIVKPWTGESGQSAFYRQITQADSKYTDGIEKMYGSVNLPVLLLWGEKDTWIPPEKGKQLNKMIPGSELKIIPDAGHLVIEEQPQTLIHQIKRFLSDE